MTTVSAVFPQNRLASLLKRPGGVKVSAAVAAAEANLQEIQGEIVAEVDRALELIQPAAKAAAEGARDAQRQVYAHAHVVAGLAATGGLEDIGAAALNLCKLVDVYIAEESWNVEAVAVHLSVMSLLRSSSGQEEAALRRCILAELSNIVGRQTSKGV
ncbi:MAG: hypothetical protein B7Y99_04795 [Caulobacterales bacterium 32-69-10]|nr:MAG: hypothetical protein B7Y99_04795 [Caulobacterales bacterium 32-69-10]